MRPSSRLFLVMTIVCLLAVPSVLCAAPDTATAGDLTEVTVLLDGLPVNFPISPFLEEGVTMVPLRALSESLGFTIVWQGDQSPIRCVRDGRTIALKLGEATVEVEVDGTVKPGTLPKAAHLQGDTTVIPLRFFSETLGYDVVWDPETYTADVISSKAAMQVWGFYALGSPNYSSWEDMFGGKFPYPMIPSATSPAAGITGAFLGWFAVDTETGSIQASGHSSGFTKPDGWGNVLMNMRAVGSKPVAMFYSDNTEGRLSALLADQSKRDRLALNMATAVTVDFAGAAVDFEGLGATEETREKDAANLNEFFAALRRYLHGPKVYAVIPPLNSAYKGYDHKNLGETCDSIVIMAYGYEDRAFASATAPWDKVDEALRLETEVVPKDKIILGIPAYGTKYASTGGVTNLESLPAARDSIGDDGAVQAWNPSSATDLISWQEGDTSYQAFVENNESLQARASLAKRHGVAGVAIWRLGFLQPGWWESLQEVVEPIR